MKNKVSIIVPVYNAEKYIEKCMESIINQTYKELEILLINDGSKDNSIKILKSYQQKDNRIVIIDRENKGSIYSRLEGMQKSTGEYVMFVDADDWLEFDTVEKTLQIAKKYNADIVRFYSIREQVKEGIKSTMNGPYKKETYIPKEHFQEYLYPVILNTYGCNTIWGQLIRKETTKNVDIKDDNIRMGDDLLINLEIYKNINSIVFTNNHFYHYRKTENSITHTENIEKIKNNIKDTYKTYSKLYEMIKIWNIDTKGNENLIKKRIIKEILAILNSVFISNIKREEKLQIIKEARELIDDEFQIDKSTLNKTSQMFLEKKYNDLIRYKTLKIKIRYLIKKEVIKVLRLINKFRRENIK